VLSNALGFIFGTGGVVVKDIKESGVYVGSPVSKIKNVDKKHTGVPTWKK
jgi:acetyltransferase-like isoleucine patch superfamily enzyme